MPGKSDLVYLDSSAFVRLFVPDPGALALQRFLAPRPRRVSALLLRTEALRAATRAGLSPPRMALVHALLDGITLIPADVALADEAGVLRPPELPSLDSLHLATARSLGARLSAFVTYDEHLAEAARWYGLPVTSPA
ncbi:MAG: type II toxin-antitoxin system VapC family toxin [Candidatus Dormibacteria bacterium]